MQIKSKFRKNLTTSHSSRRFNKPATFHVTTLIELNLLEPVRPLALFLILLVALFGAGLLFLLEDFLPAFSFTLKYVSMCACLLWLHCVLCVRASDVLALYRLCGTD